jgi:hypothetical protein
VGVCEHSLNELLTNQPYSFKIFSWIHGIALN